VTRTVFAAVFVALRVTVVDFRDVLVLVKVTVDTVLPYKKALHRELTSTGALLIIEFQRETEFAEVPAGAPWTSPRNNSTANNDHNIVDN
jgi:hypothetical protein